MSNLLLSPLAVGNLALRNRIVMAPMTRSRAQQPGDVPTALNALYYAQRAGAGLIVSEGTQISASARATPTPPVSTARRNWPAGARSPRRCTPPAD